MAKPILNLDSLIDRPVITLGEKEYWLLTPDILPPLQRHQFARDSARADALADKQDLTEEERQELAAIPNTLCRLVLDAPEDVHAGLSDAQRMLIAATAYTTFHNGLRMGLPTPAAPTSPASPSSGETSSRA